MPSKSWRFPNNFYLYCFLLLNFTILASHGFLTSYVPDAEEVDKLIFPWQLKSNWKRNIISSCDCGREPSTQYSSASKHTPWNTLVEIDKEGILTYCSGSLINSKFILTAYTCFFKKDFDLLDIWIPSSRLMVPKNVTVWSNLLGPIDPSAQRSKGLEVAEIFPNIEFLCFFTDCQGESRNVALLRLKKEIRLENNNGWTPVCLNPMMESSGTHAQLMGWGKQTGSSGLINEVHSTSLIINNLQTCRIHSTAIIANGTLCLPPLPRHFHLEGFGSALVRYSDSNEQILQVGISSFDDSKEQKYRPTHLFFTTIESVIDFIHFYSEKYHATWCQEPSIKKFDQQKYASQDEFAERPWRTEPVSSSERTIIDCTCGMTEGQGRVVGGTEAKPYEFKWQVVIFTKVIDNGQKQTMICGGSVINDRFILTAAHCVVQEEKLLNGDFPPEVEPHDIEALVHSHSRGDDPNSIKVKIKSVIYHPGYVHAFLATPMHFDWDVALLELEAPLLFDPEKVMPICLPNTNETLHEVGKIGLVTGWGKTSPEESGNLATYLQKIELPIQPLTYCTSETTSKVTDRFLCAGTLNRYKDAAGGDSGGPLSILTDKPNQYLQVGIVSWDEEIGGSSTKTAAYYQSVQKILPFIDYFSHNHGAKWCHR